MSDSETAAKIAASAGGVDAPMAHPAGNGASAPVMDEGAENVVARLRESEARLSAFLENSPGSLFVKDAEGRYVFVNQAFLAANGRPADQVIGRTDADLFPPELAELFIAEDREVREAAAPRRFEETFVFEGRTYTFLTHKFPLPGGAVGCVGTDITDQKRAEADLRTATEALQATYDTAPVGLCVLDAEMRYVRINGRMAEINGVPAADHLGRTVAEVLPDFPEEAIRGLCRVVETGEPALGIEVSGETPARPGVTRTRIESWLPFRDAAGRVVGVNVVAQEVTERKAAEDALRESETRYRTLFESVDEGFCVLEMLFDERGEPSDYRFLEANPAFERHTGLVGAIGKTARELVPDLDEFWFRIYGRVALTGEPARFENHAPAMGRWFDVYAQRVGAPEERRVALLFNDVTERKVAEEALRESVDALRASEARFRLMADAVPQIVWITDGEGRTEFFNRQWTAYTGTPFNPADPVTADDIAARHVHPDDAAGTMAAFDQARRLGRTFLTEHRIRSAAGGYRWFLVRAEPYRDPRTGEIVRWFGASVDIHDRRQAEEALRDSEARLRTLWASAPVGISVSRIGIHLYVNSVYRSIFGLPPDADLAGTPILDQVAPRDRGMIADRVRARDAGENVPDTYEAHMVRADGSEFLAEVRIASVELPDGPASVCFLTDVTERRAAEARDRFLVALDDAVRPLEDPEQITLAAARLLGEHVGADRCAYADVEDDQDTMNLAGNYLRSPEIRSIVGRLRFSDFGAEVLALMRANKPYVVHDVDTHEPPVGDPSSYHAIQMQAVVCAPLHKGGRFVAAMAVHSRTARRWTPDEVELVRLVAARCWESIERARVARGLRLSEERYRVLTLASSQVVWWTDGGGSIVRPVPLWESFTGQTFEECRGWGWLAPIHSDDRAQVTRLWREALAARSFYQCEYRLRRHDGAWRHMVVRAAPILDAVGGVAEWIGASADVTEEREAERRERFLAELSERARVLSDPDAVLATTEAALGEFLGASRVGYSEVDLTAGLITVRRDWAAGGLPGLAGVWPLSAYGVDVAAALTRGETVAVADLAADALTRDAAAAYAALGTGALVCVPFVRGGAWEASLFVTWADPRPGLDRDEVELIETVAERTRLALENARLVRGLAAENVERREAERRALLRAEQLRELADAAVAINACGSLSEMFPLIAGRARDIVGAHQAVVSITRGEDWSQAISALSLSDKYAPWRDYATVPDGAGIYTAVCRENRPMRLTQAQLLAHPEWRGFGAHAAGVPPGVTGHPPMNGWLAVPLIGGDGTNLGLIQLSDKYDGEFDAEDEAILVQLAQQASVAIENRRLLEEARAANRRIAEDAARYERIAETLQRSLLRAPSGGAAFPGLSVEPVYEAALDEAQVGGDFFDAFALDGGLVALVVGDVTGKGLVAASFTAEVKFALRAFLSEGPDPAAALTRLNRLLTGPGRAGSEDSGSTFVALALCVVDPATGALTAAAAGAEPPQVVRAGEGGAAEMTIGGLLLGVDAGAAYEAVSDVLSPGDLLVMCTDGLTEARRPEGRRDFFGPDGVAAAAEAAAHLPTLADTARAVVSAALDFAGGRQSDDVCLVLARLSPSA